MFHARILLVQNVYDNCPFSADLFRLTPQRVDDVSSDRGCLRVVGELHETGNNVGMTAQRRVDKPRPELATSSRSLANLNKRENNPRAINDDHNKEKEQQQQQQSKPASEDHFHMYIHDANCYVPFSVVV